MSVSLVPAVTTVSALWDDDAYIAECLGQGEAVRPALGSIPMDHCRWCSHVPHGFPCRCRCDSSFNSRDDSWRPVDTMATSVAGLIRSLANRCGVDGWTATAAIQGSAGQGNTAAEQARTWRVRNFLLNPYTTPTPERHP